MYVFPDDMLLLGSRTYAKNALIHHPIDSFHQTITNEAFQKAEI